MGTLAAVPGRYPPQIENEAARKLTRLAGAFVESEAVTAYVRQEIARGELTIGEPPAIADVSAIRELLLREPVVWERNLSQQQHGGLLSRVAMHLSVMRALVASALGRARRHDGTAWEDLHAAWNLTKALDGHPHIILRAVGMSMTRAINAVAWKMPLPVPAWFGEVQDRDFVRLLLETMRQKFPLKPFAERIERDRTLAAELARVTECEFNRVTETGIGRIRTRGWTSGGNGLFAFAPSARRPRMLCACVPVSRSKRARAAAMAGGASMERRSGSRSRSRCRSDVIRRCR